MPNLTYILISSVTVGAVGASSIDFTSIPNAYTDLLVKISGRGSFTGIRVQFNNDTSSNYTWKAIRGDGANAISESNVTYGSPYNTFIYFKTSSLTSDTANTFGNGEFYVPNYTSSNQKSVSLDGVTENNATTAWSYLNAGLWSGTATINSITLTMDAGGSLSQYSTAYLYGIQNS